MANRVICTTCGHLVWLRRTDGRLRTHNQTTPWFTGQPPKRCPGSGAMPSEEATSA